MSENAPADLGIRHLRGGLGHGVPDIEELLHMLVIELSEVVPNRCYRRYDVWLISAIGDDVMRSLRKAQVFAAEVDGRIHELNGIERATAAPRRTRGMRGLSAKSVLDRNEPVATSLAPANGEVVRDMREHADVDVLEVPRRERTTPWSPRALRQHPAKASACLLCPRAP